MEPQDPQMVVNQPEQQNQNLFTRLKKRKKTMIVFLLIILAWLGLYLVTLFVDKPDISRPNSTSSPQATSTPLPISELEDRESWVMYESEEFSFDYPNLNSTHLEKENGTTLLQIAGESQTENTELFDGIGLRFEIVNMEGMDLQSFVESKFAVYENFPERIVQTISSVQIDDRQGYEFVISGLGQTRHIYLHFSDTQAFYISDYSSDPNNVGYSSYVNEIISSLEF